ncbi:MAG: peptide chain release factor N(5)-glutamine methyltransferase [Candidatus Binatia bacterium]
MNEEFPRAEALGSQPVSVRQALQEGTKFLSQMGVESARLDVELLLSHVLGWRREKVWLNGEVPLGSNQTQRFEHGLKRRALGEPVAYIIGVREFWSLDFLVSPAVLVPRPETELVVEITLGLMKSLEASGSKLRILDLGTGSGAIAVSLASESENIQLWATDLSPGALKVAAVNAARHGVRDRVHLFQGDLFEPVKQIKDSFDMIVSNPPYIRRGEMKGLPPDVRDWEPRLALDGGSDGLDFYRLISENGHAYLRDGGFMLLEIGDDMGSEVSRLLARIGRYTEVSVHPDYTGRDRVVVARKLPRGR